MEKTISITLNKQNFIIEEEAYNKLADYLENIKTHCGAGADSAEVIADIENSMAEKLKSNLTAYKEVITVADVEALIEIMGTTEDFDREVGETKINSNEETENKKTSRKLYRDMDNAIVGGVAAGLGNYFDIDPVLIRVVFFALIFAGGSGFMIYILLWFAMPEAKTAHQKLEMKGQAPTLAAFKNLAQTGKKMQDNFKKSWQKRSISEKIISFPRMIISGFIEAIKNIWNRVWPIIKFFFGLGLATFSFIGLGAIGIGSLFMLLYNNSDYQLYFIPISELTSLLPYTWLVVTGFLSLAIPAIIAFVCGISIIFRKSIINFTVGAILLTIWMMSGIFFCAVSLRYFPEIQNKFKNNELTLQSEESIDLKDIKEIVASGQRINVFVSASTSTLPTLSGRVIDLDNIEITRLDNKLIIKEEKETAESDEICLNCDLHSVSLRVASSSNFKITTEDGAYLNQEAIEIEPEIVEIKNATEEIEE